MNTLQSIKSRIAILKDKSIESLLTKKENIEIGKLYITAEMILEHTKTRKIKRISYADIEECNEFLNSNGRELVCISWDYIKNIHVIYYK